MAKESIKVSLSGRTFPVLVDEEEVAVIRQAAKMINDKINFFRLEYGMREETDIALMCCLELATELLKMQHQQSLQNPEALIAKLALLEKHLDVSRYIAE